MTMKPRRVHFRKVADFYPLPSPGKDTGFPPIFGSSPYPFPEGQGKRG
jgi:hypothetical protein